MKKAYRKHKKELEHLFEMRYDNYRAIVYRVVASRLQYRREVVWMELFTFQDLLLFATFLIALLTYNNRENKRK